MKKEVDSYSHTHAKISKIVFQALSSAQIQSLAVVEMTRKEIYDPITKTPMVGGPLDLRLGLSRKEGVCETCSESLANCCGHFGYYRLALPVFHVGFFRYVYIICQTICKSCSKILLHPAKKAKYLQGLKKTTELGHKRLITKIAADCKRATVCFHCKSSNGKVRKAPGMKIFVESAQKLRKDSVSPSLKEDLCALRCLNLFKSIPKDEYILLGVNQPPMDFIMENVLIPPAPIRPSVPMGQDGSNEDDLTVKISEIIHCNQILVNSIKRGNPYSVVLEDWDFLQNQCAQLIQPDATGKPIKGLLQRLKGKHGRFRGNLSGKRVDFSSRTVISPDPNLGVGQIGVPEYVAKVLTIPEKVTDFNIEKLRTLVINGMKYPGANYITRFGGQTETENVGSRRKARLSKEDVTLGDEQGSEVGADEAKDATKISLQPRSAQKGISTSNLCSTATNASEHEVKVFLKYGDRDQASKDLRIGDIVERHLLNNDMVLFNRQPSLHRLSIMAHRVKVHSDKTFKFNECVCLPYNADFDGDEMNIHVLQTYQSRAEASVLMGVDSNLLSPRNGEPLIAAIQDFITGLYLLTSKNTFFNAIALGQYSANLRRKIVVKPVIIRPQKLYTGKQLVQMILEEVCAKEGGSSEEQVGSSRKPDTKITLISQNKSYMSNWGVNDGHVVIIKNVYFFGRLDKSIIGTENKETSLLYLLIKKSRVAALSFLNLISKLLFLTDLGFSIGLEDVTSTATLNDEKKRLFEEGYAMISKKIIQYRTGDLEPESGCSLEETLENHITSILNKIRESCGNLCLERLSVKNVAIIMQSCGSKGSKINVSQMVACVGQQVISGKRVPNGFSGRALPHFALESKMPRDKGFVASSFRSGLTSSEFFFHAVSGREGLVDTAVKTAETGYMQRRLMKALEDLSVMYDGTVRSPDNRVIQYVCGEDFVDPSLVECDDKVRMDVLYEEITAEIRTPVPEEDRVNIWKSFGGDLQENTVPSVDISSVEMSQHIKMERFLDEKIDTCESFLLKKYFKDYTSRFKSYYKKVYNNILESMKVEPGTAVGALACQSIGEPGTQMTLKTFHFAGVASMNITLGVPRLKEIINAVKNISTPIIKASLLNPNSLEEAKRVKGRIDRVYLKDVMSSVTEIYTKDEIFLEIEVCLETIFRLKLEIDLEHIKKTMEHEFGSRASTQARKASGEPQYPSVASARPQLCSFIKDNKITFYLRKESDKYFSVKEFKRKLGLAIISRIKAVKRVILAKDKDYKLFVEGTGLKQIFITEGVNYEKTTTNNIAEIESVLGIEAARECVIREMQYTVSSHGIKIDPRHLMLLADTMTCKGELFGITRFGISKMKTSTLMLASFEQTGDHLFDAAVKNKRDTIKGVSESVIMGLPISMGTGSVELFYKG